MDRILIIGSGASGVHFALSVLRKGYEVIMLDVGHKKPEAVNPEDSFNGLKSNLSDPVRYFLGQNYEAVIYPDSKSEYYGFPPNKSYVFSKPSEFRTQQSGFAPLFSFARGGLAEVWTAGVYPLNEHELGDFPFGYRDLEPFYNEVANRIGISGVKDDLARFLPFHENIMEPLRLDQHSQQLLAKYEQRKSHLNGKFSCYLGRSRVATISADKEGRKGCTYLGRCLWGCPSESLYTPSVTLNRCKNYSSFTYVPDVYVSHFKFRSGRQIGSVIAESVVDKSCHEITADKFVLAAGALSSSKIFMDSIFKNTGEVIKLHGLMDNRQILVPFINLSMIGKRYEPQNYQYHQVAMGIECEKPSEYIHGQITTLKTASAHPIIQSMPFDLKTSVSMFRAVRAALGIVNINLHDSRREDNYVTLEANHKSPHTKLVIDYSPPVNEKSLIKQAMKRVKKALWSLGCLVPPGVVHIRPMGASVHYAGTVPMSAKKNACTSSEYCQSHDFDNLYIVDGTTFPFLPAKNLTFTLMANAVRVAECAF